MHWTYPHNNDCNIAFSWTPESKIRNKKKTRNKATCRRKVEKNRTENRWFAWAKVRVVNTDKDG